MNITNAPQLEKGVSVKDGDDLHGSHVPSFKAARDLRKYCAASPRPVLLTFKAPWCAPCRSMKTPLKKLAKHFGDRLLLLEVDIEWRPAIAASYRVNSVPLFILVSGKKVIARLEGAHSFTELKTILEKHLPVAEGTP